MAVQGFGFRMVLTRVSFLSGILLLVSCGSNEPTEELQVSTEKMSGKQLFEQHCTMCHGEDGRLGSGGAADLTASTLDKNGIRKILIVGKNAMPSMKDRLGDALEKVVDYTKELSKK